MMGPDPDPSVVFSVSGLILLTLGYLRRLEVRPVVKTLQAARLKLTFPCSEKPVMLCVLTTVRVLLLLNAPESQCYMLTSFATIL